VAEQRDARPAPGAQTTLAHGAPDGRERRTNPRLRELIDEMLASVRVAVRRELWTEAERREYEADLADVMRQVRFEAVWRGPPPAQSGEGGGANELAERAARGAPVAAADGPDDDAADGTS